MPHDPLGHEALATYREIGDDTGATVPVAVLGFAAAQRGDSARAATLMTQGLIVTENTVKTHVTSLFNKLDVVSRAQAVAVAAHQGLV